jgi:hypothetical protein
VWLVDTDSTVGHHFRRFESSHEFLQEAEEPCNTKPSVRDQNSSGAARVWFAGRAVLRLSFDAGAHADDWRPRYHSAALKSPAYFDAAAPLPRAGVFAVVEKNWRKRGENVRASGCSCGSPSRQRLTSLVASSSSACSLSPCMR